METWRQMRFKQTDRSELELTNQRAWHRLRVSRHLVLPEREPDIMTDVAFY
jgi:hypothetical protein